jgi:hypothetical protein
MGRNIDVIITPLPAGGEHHPANVTALRHIYAPFKDQGSESRQAAGRFVEIVAN